MTLSTDELHARFEQRLLEVAVADSPFVTEAATHVIAAGGKRFRPQLVFLASETSGGADASHMIDAALVMELTHVASLYHDDVMDEADLRRGVPSANARWDNTVAILVGDFLFARASEVVAGMGPEYVALQARTFARLVQGQIAETIGPSDEQDPLEHYLQVIADKTGSLIAASAVFGAMVAGAPDDISQALRAYAEEIGVVFQLSDDLIDITSEETGKTPGTDLREGVPTLPVLMLRQSSGAEDVALLQLIDGDLSDDQDLARVLGLLRAHPVMGQAEEYVRARARMAVSHVAFLPDSPAKASLLEIAHELVERTS